MNRCIIVGAGLFNNKDLKIDKNDFVIACDAGYLHCKKNNIKANLLIGDFDSLKFVPKAIEIIKLDPIKDDTDVLDAVKEGIKRGYRDFLLLGTTGKRLEHTIANISILKFIKEEGFTGEIVNNKQHIKLLHNETIEFDESYKGYISAFSTSDESIISIKGLKYEIENYKLKNSNSLGVDNEFIGKYATISVKSGYLLLMYNEK